MTAVTPILRPDDLLARGWPDSFPGRAANPHEWDVLIHPLEWFPRTPVETTIVYRRG